MSLSESLRSRRPGRASPIASIRFQVSLVLLVSALNGILLVVLAGWLASPGEELQGIDQLQLGLLQGRLESVHEEVLAGESTAEGEDEVLDGLQKEVADLGEAAQELGYALKDYRWTLSARRASELEDGDQQLRQVHLRVLGALHVLQREQRTDPPPLWVLGLMLGWVVLTTLATVVVALSLRGVLSAPLRDLARAASRVGEGELDKPFPDPSGAEEFRKLGRALESMRTSLVSSIEDFEEQNAVQTAMLQVLNDGVLFLDQEERVMGFNPAASLILATRDVDLQEGTAVQTAVPGLPVGSINHWAGNKLELDFIDDDDEQYLTVCAHRVDVQGPGLRSAWVVVVRDVTKAVEVEGLKRDFLSVVTHELKTPLTVIDGYLRLLMRGKGGGLTDKQRELLGRSSEQVAVLTRMVQDLLDATRLEGGNLQLEIGSVDAGAALEECAHGLAGDADARGIHLACEVGAEARAAIRADPFRLQQVLGNLVRNALKFTPEGGRVTLTGTREGDAILLAVTDTGRGIPSSALPRLFDKFYQVQRGDTRKAGGAGLGLYICDQLVRAMGGELAVASTVGEGSTFTARLNRVPTQEEA